MFKELFITGLLSFTLGSTSLKENNVLFRELNNQINSFNYGYCFVDETDYDAIYEYWEDFRDGETFEFSTEYNSVLNVSSGNGLITCFNGDQYYNNQYSGSAYTYYNDIQYWDFTIYRDSDDWICVDVTIHFVNPLLTCNYGILVDHNGVVNYKDYNSSFFFGRSAIYFKNRYVSTYEYEYRLYRLLFTNTNNYVEDFTGWYTFNATQSDNYYFSMCGILTVNNNYYQEVSKTNTQLDGRWRTTIGMQNFGEDDTWDYLYNDGKYAERSITQCYFTNTLLPSALKDVMARDGVFGYVPTVNSYSFGDMLFSIMDSPVYMLQQLFSFELFGIQFYVAFMSIVTVILIAFVVRKLV